MDEEKRLANASAEERALARKMERMGDAERIKQAGAAEASAKNKLEANEWEIVIEKSTLAISLLKEDVKLELYEYRCIAEVKTDQFADALIDINYLLEKLPEAGKYLVLQGEVYEGLDRKEEALESFKKALQVEPERDELEAVIKELKLQIDEDSGVGLGDLITNYILSVKRRIKNYIKAQKEKLFVLRNAYLT